MLHRRDALKLLSGATVAGASLPFSSLMGGPAHAQAARSLNVNLLGFALGIHVPTTAALKDILPTYPGYGEPKTQRLEQIRVAFDNAGEPGNNPHRRRATRPPVSRAKNKPQQCGRRC